MAAMLLVSIPASLVLFDSVVRLLLVGGAAVGAAFFMRLHFLRDKERYGWKDDQQKREFPFSQNLIDLKVAEYRERLGRASALDAYVTSLLATHEVRMRTVERITPLSRTLHREVRHEYNFKTGRPDVLPVLLLKRGVLQDYRTVTDGGSDSPLRVLTYLESSCCALAAVKRLFDLADPLERPHGYSAARSEAEKQVARFLVPEDERTEGTRATECAAVRGSVSALADLSPTPEVIHLVGEIVELYRDHYAICVDVMEAEVEAEVIVMNDYVIPHHRTPERPTRLRSALSKLGHAMRVATGSRPARYRVSGGLATFAASYHLEMVGPERTYLTSQRFHGTGRAELEELKVYDRWTSRRGQRFAHLYIRGGYRLDKPITIQLGFMERPPGSLAHAGVAAATASFLSAIGFLLVRAGDRSTAGHEALSDYGPFVAATLLTLPVAGAVWAGFSMPESFVGQMAYARISAGTTFVLSFAAAGALALDQRTLLLFLMALQFANSAFVIYWWIIRALLYSRLIERPPPSERGGADDE